MPKFDLIQEPWIPVVTLEGAAQVLSLAELFAAAPELAEVRDENPLVEWGLYRFLIALVLDMFRPEREADVALLAQAKRFDPAVVSDYLGRHGDRFDLFSAQHPFLQDPSLRDAERKPVAPSLATTASISRTRSARRACSCISRRPRPGSARRPASRRLPPPE